MGRTPPPAKRQQAAARGLSSLRPLMPPYLQHPDLPGGPEGRPACWQVAEEARYTDNEAHAVCRCVEDPATDPSRWMALGVVGPGQLYAPVVLVLKLLQVRAGGTQAGLTWQDRPDRATWGRREMLIAAVREGRDGRRGRMASGGSVEEGRASPCPPLPPKNDAKRGTKKEVPEAAGCPGAAAGERPTRNTRRRRVSPESRSLVSHGSPVPRVLSCCSRR